MKNLLLIVIGSCITSFSFAGTNSGGGGTRPGMEMFQAPINSDLVKTLGMDSSGRVQFKYKGFDSSKIEIKSLDIKDFADSYLEALKKSNVSKNWEAVTVEGLEN